MEELRQIKQLCEARPDADVLFKCILHKELPEPCCKGADSTCVGIVRECMKGLGRIRQKISVAVEGDRKKIDYIYKNIIWLITTTPFWNNAIRTGKFLGYGSVLGLLAALAVKYVNNDEVAMLIQQLDNCNRHSGIEIDNLKNAKRRLQVDLEKEKKAHASTSRALESALETQSEYQMV